MARSRAQSGGSKAPCRVHCSSRTQQGGGGGHASTHSTHFTDSHHRHCGRAKGRVLIVFVPTVYLLDKTPWGFVHSPTRCLAACWHAWYAGRKRERGCSGVPRAEADRQSRRVCSCGRARPARRSVGKIPSTSRIRAGGASMRKPTAAAWWRGCSRKCAVAAYLKSCTLPRAPSARRSLARLHRSVQQAGQGIDAEEACAGRAWDGYDRNEDSQGAGPDIWRLGPLCFGPLAARQQRRQTRNGPTHTYTPTVALRWTLASCYSVRAFEGRIGSR